MHRSWIKMENTRAGLGLGADATTPRFLGSKSLHRSIFRWSSAVLSPLYVRCPSGMECGRSLCERGAVCAWHGVALISGVDVWHRTRCERWSWSHPDLSYPDLLSACVIAPVMIVVESARGCRFGDVPMTKKTVFAMTEVTQTPSSSLWCPGWDLNPHGLPHTPLKRTRLPIPPPGRAAPDHNLWRHLRHCTTDRVAKSTHTCLTTVSRGLGEKSLSPRLSELCGGWHPALFQPVEQVR